jgi:hypothetical protein
MPDPQPKQVTRIFPDEPPYRAMAFLRDQFEQLGKDIPLGPPYTAQAAQVGVHTLANLCFQLCRQLVHFDLKLHPAVLADPTIVNPSPSLSGPPDPAGAVPPSAPA